MIFEQELVQLLPDNRLLTVSTNHINIYKMPDAHVDEHATALYTYFDVFDDLQYSRDLRQHYTTRTIS